ncbi:MAG TPA: AarF/ABC1/UbiB kinase family protein [Acidimicrobiales bacterium]|nr:AarF/ABC1/UbiB kinase family protein [Acidimicrobiales bacterium]
MGSYHDRQVQIAEVVVRHGWEHVLEFLGLEGLVSFERRLLGRNSGPTAAVDLRLALEELGATFVKLGQFASTRADLLPPDYQSELAKLQDDDPPVPQDQIEDIVGSELKTAADKVFATFDPVPLASASIGQAHAATLHDGTDVVVKVRRPGVVEQVEEDLEIIHNLAVRLSQRWEEAARWDVVGLSEELGRSLRAELDYLQEAANAERFAANFANEPGVEIPRVFRDLSTSRVITLERLRGMKVTDLAALDAAGIDRPTLAQQATRRVAKEVFEDGFFHGDPHPGNFFVQASGRVGMIDFGRMGTVDDRLRSQLRKLLMALMGNDPDRLVSAFLALGTSTGPIDRDQLRGDLAGLLSRTGQGDASGAVEATVNDVLEVIRRYRLRIPRDLALLLRVIIMEEGLLTTLDPDFELTEALAPYARRAFARELSPAALARRVEKFGIDTAELAVDLPGQLHRVLDALGDSGGFEVHLRAAELQPLMGRAEHLGNRIAASILAAAAINGLSGLAARRGDGHGWLTVGLGAVGSLGAYAAWRRSPAGAMLHRLRSASK